MRAAWVIVVTLVLAGCITPEEPVDGAAIELAEPSVAATLAEAIVNLSSVEAPVWNVGDAWGVTTMGDASENAVIVVTAATGDAYTLETTSATMAGFDAMLDVSYLGRIRASDLAGSQRDTPVQFFSFPLEDGKTWTTTWDGLEVTLVAKALPSIPTPLGAQPGFAIVGTAGDAPHVEYDYVPALGWWSHIMFAEGYGLKVEKVHENWTGTLATATAALVFESETVAPVATINTAPFAISEGQTYAALTLLGGSSAYARALVLTDPTGAPYMTSTSNAEAMPEGGGFYFFERLPATPGEWHISSPIAHQQDGWFLLTVHEVLEGTRAFP